MGLIIAVAALLFFGYFILKKKNSRYTRMISRIFLCLGSALLILLILLFIAIQTGYME